MKKIEEEDKDLFLAKIEEHSSLMHTLRHDLRNYIAAIEGYAYLLKEEYNEEYLERIFSNISNINELIDRSVLLADAELTIENETEINLNSVVKTCQEIIPDNVSLKMENLPAVLGNYSKIQYVIKSIIHNAIVHGKPNEITIKGKKDNDENFILLISNDGEPIPADKTSKLFTQIPQSLKPNAGVSLLTVKKIVDAHKWTIKYNNQVKDTTTFELTIPKESLIK